METKTKKKKITQEEIEELNRVNELRGIKERIANGSIPTNPTRLFQVGDSVKIGALQNIKITEVLFDGLAYRIHYDYIGQAHGQPKRMIGDGVWDWMSVLPMSSYCHGKPLRIKDDIVIRFYNNDIDSLLHKVYYSGVDFNPSYQRDLVWTMEQKLSLVDSIFNNVDIGKFTFIKHDYSRELCYEILDGKQRLSTICEFYENRFAWKGKKFTELCAEDARHFTGFPIIQGEVSEITQQQIYRLFVKMNTTGTPVSKEHLEKIRSLINSAS